VDSFVAFMPGALAHEAEIGGRESKRRDRAVVLEVEGCYEVVGTTLTVCARGGCGSISLKARERGAHIEQPAAV
jgi:hypothetical protein